MKGNPLEKYFINDKSLHEANSLIWNFYRVNNSSFPGDKSNFYIAGYYIISRHPDNFPVHETKEDFCNIFKRDHEVLRKFIGEITSSLNYIRIFVIT